MYLTLSQRKKYYQTVVLSLIILFSVQFSVAQEKTYHVVKTFGTVKDVASGKIITQGRELSAANRLQLLKAEAGLILIDEKADLYEVLTNAPAQALLKDLIKKVNTYDTQRGFKKVEKERKISNLDEYFGKGTYTLIGDTLRIKLDEEVYPLNNDQFIVFHYKINGEQISKKVGFNHQYLILNKAKLRQGTKRKHKENIIKRIAVYQHERSTEKTKFITRFNMQFVGVEELAGEFNVIKHATRNNFTSHKVLIDQFYKYVDAVYENTDHQTLERLMSAVKFQ